MRRLLAVVAPALVVVACASGSPGGPVVDDARGSTPTPPASAPPSTAEAEPDRPVVVVDDVDGIVCWSAPTADLDGGIVLVDATAEAGLVTPLTGMHAHAAAFGDVDGDLTPDLVVGTFADRPPQDYAIRGSPGPSPDRLLLSTGDSYLPTTDLDGLLGRSSGAVFADLDLDGDLDLVLARNPRNGERRELPTEVYENVGGHLTVVPDAGVDPLLGARSVGVLDADRDGMPDLFVTEDRWSGGSSRLYRNVGDLRFEDATSEMGLPTDVHGLGVVTADFDGDGATDLFVSGSNRLFASVGGGFEEVDSAVFAWDLHGDEDDVAGADAADVDRDGRLDLVVGQHFNSTIDDDTEVAVRLYLNTSEPGALSFVDATDEAGLTPIPTKAPHVQFADLDNDGWPDIVTSASAGDGTLPAVFRHEGLDGGVPVFSTPEGLGSDQYWVTAPVADVDRDGRLDILAVEWEPSIPSVLYRNESSAGGWVEVSVDAGLGGGPGTTVAAYESGRSGTGAALLGFAQIAASAGYSAGIEATVHLGLADRRVVDLVVTPPTGPVYELAGVPAGSHVRLPTGCPEPSGR